MNLGKTLLLVLNTIFGFIQIGIVLFIQPFAYWLWPLAAVLGFILGYKDTIGDIFKDKWTNTIGLILLFLSNLIIFILVTVVYFDTTADASSVMLILVTMMIITTSNFQDFGKFLGRKRKS